MPFSHLAAEWAGHVSRQAKPVEEESARQSCDNWNCKEGFANTDTAGSHHLRSVSLGSRMKPYSNEEQVDMLIVYAAAESDGHTTQWLYQDRNRNRRVPHRTTSETDKYPKVFVIEDTVDGVRDSFCRNPDKSIRQDGNDIQLCSPKSLVNQSTHYTYCCVVHIFTNEVREAVLSSAIAE
ncbi:hypothetical protein TNCV_21391 [Trichonephila clavipes]|nr:hypothetical protein TNCV_21391 [Trichonephila clavipes]